MSSSKVSFDEESNQVNRISAVSPDRKDQLWVSKSEIAKRRKEVHLEGMMAQANDMVTKTIVKIMGERSNNAEFDEAEVEKQVAEVLKGGPQSVLDFLEKSGIALDDTIGEDQTAEAGSEVVDEDTDEDVDESKAMETVRDMVKKKLISEQTSFSTSSEDFQESIDSIMKLPKPKIMEFLDVEREASVTVEHIASSNTQTQEDNDDLKKPETKKAKKSKGKPKPKSKSTKAKMTRSAEEAFEAYEKKIRDKDQAISSLEETLKIKEEEVENLKQKHNHMDTLLQRLEEQLDEAEEKLLRIEAERDTNVDELEETRKRMEALETRLQALNAKQNEKEVTDWIRDLGTQIVASPQAVNSLHSGQNTPRNFQSEMEELVRKDEESQAKMKKANEQIRELELKLENSIGGKDGPIGQEDDPGTLWQSVVARQEHTDNLLGKLDEKLGAPEFLQKEKEEELETANERIKDLEAKLKKAERSLQGGEEGDKQADSTENDDSGDEKSVITGLREELKEREWEIDGLKQDLSFAHDAIERFESVRGVPEGYSPANKKRVEERDSEIADLKKKLKETESEKLSAKDAEIDSLKEELHSYKKPLQEFKETAQDTVMRELPLSAKRKSAQTTLTLPEASTDVSRLGGLLEEKQWEIDELQGQLEEARNQIVKLKDSHTDGTKKKDESQKAGAIDEKDVTIKSLTDKVEALSFDLRCSVKDRDFLISEKDRKILSLQSDLDRVGKENIKFQENDREGLDPEESISKNDEMIQSLSDQVEQLQIDPRSTVKERDRKWMEKDFEIESLQAEINLLKNGMMLQRDIVTDAPMGKEGHLQEKLDEQLDLTNSLLKQLEASENILDERQQIITTQTNKLEESESLIRSMEREMRKQKRVSGILSKEEDPLVLDAAVLKSELEETSKELAECKMKLMEESAANKAAHEKHLVLESAIEDHHDELAVKNREIELLELLKDQNHNLKKSLDSNRQTIDKQMRTIEDKISIIQSLKAKEAQQASCVITGPKGSLDQVLEAANMKTTLHEKKQELEEVEEELSKYKARLKREEAANKKAMKNIHFLESEREEWVSSNSGKDSPGLGSKEARETRQELMMKLEKEVAENKRARKKIVKLQKELDEQLSEWDILEKEMQNAKARMGGIESQFASEYPPRISSHNSVSSRYTVLNDKAPMAGDHININLEGLTKKVIDARSQLETAHKRLNRTVGRHRVSAINHTR